MEDLRVGRRYALALFETAHKFDVIASVEEDLNAIVALLERDDEFTSFLVSPYTSRDEKLQIIDKLFSDRITALTMQLLRLMLEKRRETDIIHVRDEFSQLRRKHEGVLHVHVTSAEELVAEQRTALLAKLSVLLDKKIEAEFDIDPLLIGGLKVAYDNNVMDGTARGALHKLRENLTYDLIKRVR